MRVLIFGANGQVGRAASVAAVARGWTPVPVTREDADLTEPDAIRARLAKLDFDGIINAAAYTHVDRAEETPHLAAQINTEAAGIIAAEATAHGAPLLHLSTDYVFDGMKGAPYVETDAPSPLNVYGQTKFDGERRVLAVGGRAAVLRLSWVFAATGRNFVRTMLVVGDRDGAVRVVDDQTGRPTAAPDAANAALDLLAAIANGPADPGVYQYDGGPAVTWAGFARAIFDTADIDVDVTPIATADWPTPAARPGDVRLDGTKLERATGIGAGDWRAALPGIIDALRTQGTIS